MVSNCYWCAMPATPKGWYAIQHILHRLDGHVCGVFCCILKSKVTVKKLGNFDHAVSWFTWSFMVHMVFHGSHGRTCYVHELFTSTTYTCCISLQHSTMAYLGLNGSNLYMIHFSSDTDIHRLLKCCFIPFFLHCDSLPKQLHKTRMEFDSFKILVLSPEGLSR